MANIASYNVTLISSDGLDRFKERTFTVKPGVRAFLPKDDQDNVMGFGIGRASKALGNNKYYQADEHNAWIDSPTISRRHAVLSVERNPPHLTIVNVAATHGLFVNDARVDEKQSFLLKNGDTIRLSGEVRRGEELIPPRTFKVFAQSINNTPPSSPDEAPQVRSFRVPEADSDEEESLLGIDDAESSISDEQEISQIDPSETGFVEDSMVHPFSDVEASENEGFDSGLPYGHEGHDYELSDDEFDDDLEKHGQMHEEPDHSQYISQDRVSTSQANSQTRELLELQSPQPEKPNNQRLANLVAASAMVDFQRSSSPISSEGPEITQQTQTDGKTNLLSTALNGQKNGGETVEPETIKSSATITGQSSNHPASQDNGFGMFDSKQPARVEPKAANTRSDKTEPTRYTRDRDAETMQHFMMQLASVEAQYNACAPPTQSSMHPRYEESLDCEFPRTLDNPFTGSIAPSMSLDRILDSPAKDNKSFTSSDPPSSFSGDLPERGNWIPPFTNATHHSSATIGSDSRYNPWALYDQPVNEYHEGPFASVKIESMLNNDPPRDDSLQTTGSAQATLSRKTETEGNIVAKKSGISILDIVENTQTDSIGAPRSLKRKIADLVSFSDATEQNVSSDVGTETSPTILPLESNKDNQGEPVATPEDLVKIDDLNICSRPHKKSKLSNASSGSSATRSNLGEKVAPNSTLRVVKKTLTTAAAGAVVGGLAVFSALAFLPEAVFQ